MKINKFKTYELDKCYAVAKLEYNDQSHVIVAAEKVDACLLFDTKGNLEEKIWDGPGGTMSIAQIPGSNGEFLATQLFYSPNDSADARIMYVKPQGKDDWKVRMIAKIPFVHRFDIVERGGVKYMIACELKTGHAYKEDWSSPGQVSVAELPYDLSLYNESHLLDFRPIKTGMLKNHGYYKMQDENGDYSIVSADNGVFKFVPPIAKGKEWTIEQLIDAPASDAAMVDFDGDGQLEMIVITPFHGDYIKIYKLIEGKYKEVFAYEKATEFAHSIWAGKVYGKPAAIIGHRKGTRDLLAITYENVYKVHILDPDVGSANVLRYTEDGVEYLVSTNREINEIAFYEIQVW